ncbi:MAG: hypothetical protein QG636_339 [Patescibacteria group bacterium]|jgi:hypothetical protein|nr:hypothetical protein [Patescibacteria group bacterium]
MSQKEDEVTTIIERFHVNRKLFDDLPWLWAITPSCDFGLKIAVRAFNPADLTRPADERFTWWIKTRMQNLRECVLAVEHDPSRNLAADIEYTVALIAGLEIQFLVLDDRTDFTRKLIVYRPPISEPSLADLCVNMAQSS